MTGAALSQFGKGCYTFYYVSCFVFLILIKESHQLVCLTCEAVSFGLRLHKTVYGVWEILFVR